MFNAKIDTVPLSHQDLYDVVMEVMSEIDSTLNSKAKEYASDEDRAQNFTDAARFDEVTRERALWGMMLKHLVSIKKIIHDLDKGFPSQRKVYVEKIGDSINYLILLRALLDKRSQMKGSDE